MFVLVLGFCVGESESSSICFVCVVITSAYDAAAKFVMQVVVVAVTCHPLGWFGFGSVRFGSVGPGWPWLGLAWLGLAWLGLAWLGLAWLGLAWLGLAWLGLAWLGWA